MMNQYTRFVFEEYHLDTEKKTVSLRYSFDEKEFFTETFVFDFEWTDHIDFQTLDRAIQGLWFMCGISYFKATLPPEIAIKNKPITTKQSAFFDKIYTLGLGEFFYKNQIDPSGKVKFPKKTEAKPHAFQKSNVKYSGNLVLVGGGKDSITTAEILKSQNEDFETLTVGAYPFFEGMQKRIGKTHRTVHRKIDPKLFDLNKKGALNGHVPISSILGFVSVVTAILRGQKNIILSNEQSANEPNVILDSGISINHQYSKSLEFEKDFQTYIHENIHPEIDYFSFLRPLSELHIAEIFCTRFFEKYNGFFASCNRNFTIQKTNTQFQWCGECPKCAFVYLLFAPFLSRESLDSLFGKNLLADENLQTTFQELLGQKGIKPFECVGEIQEVQQAVGMAAEKKDYKDFVSLCEKKQDFEWKKWGPHAMPKDFEKKLKKAISA